MNLQTSPRHGHAYSSATDLDVKATIADVHEAGCIIAEHDSGGRTHASMLRALWGSGGAGLIAMAAFLFSCSSLCVKLLIMRSEMPVFQITLVTSLLCLLGTSAVLIAQREALYSPGTTALVLRLTLLRGALGSVALALFYSSIQRLPLKDAVTLFFTSPVIVVLLEKVVVPGEPPSLASTGGCVATVAGVWLISQTDCLLYCRVHAVGVALATAAAVANAAAFVTIRVLSRQAPPVPSVLVLTWWYQLLVAATALVPLMLRYPSPPVVPGRRECMLLIVISSAQFVGQILLNRGFQLQSASRGSAINVLQVIFSYAWDALILHGKTNHSSLLGALMVVLGVLAATVLEGGGECGSVSKEPCTPLIEYRSQPPASGEGSDARALQPASDTPGTSIPSLKAQTLGL